MAVDMPALRLRSVAKSFATPQGPLKVLGGVDLDLHAGETLALTGESGSGKSTLLHLAAGLDAADSGKIWVNGDDISGLNEAGRAALRRTQAGLVFQQFNLIPSLKVRANAEFQARIGSGLDPDWRHEVLTRLGVASLLDRYPEQLSGGQQQRVAIARTLIARPRLILADEPTGNLDAATGDAVLELMLAAVAETGGACLMVTHSERLAGRLNRRAHLADGRLV